MGDLWWKFITDTGESRIITKVIRLTVNACYKTSVRAALRRGRKNGTKSWFLDEFGVEFKKFFHKKVGAVSAYNVKVLNFTKKSEFGEKKRKSRRFALFQGVWWFDLENLSIFWKFLEEKGLRALVGTRGSLASNRFWGIGRLGKFESFGQVSMLFPSGKYALA